ncbi:GNAT family N-acetyltransferase [Paenibacillus sp. sptzw28]|uniref:GNAT family N-acetyltransferase n=1 Tax=Paenibacillus sp. sptzw28 TaxID=715179 RepID=UPI001C6E76D0|nr:GNAT family N-acetyltransferase [Paenibacillus sp. sptzw28]QYR19327.1 GNAT family N-acetyltransferase [Paenibacillus sp. sptzw28]
MQASIRLVKPSLDYRDEYISFYEEWKRSGENIVPWVVEREPYDFPSMIEFLYSQDSEEKIMNENWVPHSTYWLLNEADSIVAAVNIRHKLNQKLINNGGHIGYGVRPSQRRKGYASLLLSLALLQTKTMELSRVLVVCDKGNTGSERTIIKNGGKFESEFTEENGNVVRRFWIELE